MTQSAVAICFQSGWPSDTGRLAATLQLAICLSTNVYAVILCFMQARSKDLSAPLQAVYLVKVSFKLKSFQPGVDGSVPQNTKASIQRAVHLVVDLLSTALRSRDFDQRWTATTDAPLLLGTNPIAPVTIVSVPAPLTAASPVQVQQPHPSHQNHHRRLLRLRFQAH